MTNEKQHTSTFKKNYESSNLKRSNISNPTGISLGGGSTLGNQKQLTSIFKKDILASKKPNNSSNLSERAAIPEKYSSSTRVKPVIEQPTIECPICRLKFQRDLIERHASTCKDNGDDGFSIIISDLDDSEDMTLTGPCLMILMKMMFLLKIFLKNYFKFKYREVVVSSGLGEKRFGKTSWIT